MANWTWKRVILGGGVACVVVVASLAGRGLAAGIPTSNTLTYSGTLAAADGTPLNGTYQIGVSLWDAASAGTTSLCSVAPASTVVHAGRFTVALPQLCVDAIHSKSTIAVEVVVNDTALPRTPLGAAPFAVEADRASAATGALDSRIKVLEVPPVDTYVHWGQSSCPAGATLLYAGYAASGNYNHSGGGDTNLCLPKDPEWAAYDDANQNGALVYGTEFETNGYGVSTLAGLQDRDATCAVCEVAKRKVLMVPAKLTCPAGWNLEYKGYLMATHYTHATAHDFVCVDANPEIAGASTNSNGSLWYPTEVECGSLPCQAGGYVQDRELTCAVCSK